MTEPVIVEMIGTKTHLTVWFCTMCRDDIQIGAKPDMCRPCDNGNNLVRYQVPYVPVTYATVWTTS